MLVFFPLRIHCHKVKYFTKWCCFFGLLLGTTSCVVAPLPTPRSSPIAPDSELVDSIYRRVVALKDSILRNNCLHNNQTKLVSLDALNKYIEVFNSCKILEQEYQQHNKKKKNENSFSEMQLLEIKKCKDLLIKDSQDMKPIIDTIDEQMRNACPQNI